MRQERYTYLREKAEHYADQLNAAQADDDDPDVLDDLRDSLYLEVVPFAQIGTDADAYRVEFVLELGGPTTRVIVDSRWGVTLESTDGPIYSHSYSYDSIDVSGDARATFEAEAEHIMEIWR